jgi:hypothetical protein
MHSWGQWQAKFNCFRLRPVKRDSSLLCSWLRRRKSKERKKHEWLWKCALSLAFLTCHLCTSTVLWEMWCRRVLCIWSWSQLIRNSCVDTAVGGRKREGLWKECGAGAGVGWLWGGPAAFPKSMQTQTTEKYSVRWSLFLRKVRTWWRSDSLRSPSWVAPGLLAEAPPSGPWPEGLAANRSLYLRFPERLFGWGLVTPSI